MFDSTIYRSQKRIELGAGECTIDGRQGTTVDVHWGITGELLCTVDIGENVWFKPLPTTFEEVAEEVGKIAERQGKGIAKGFIE